MMATAMAVARMVVVAATKARAMAATSGRVTKALVAGLVSLPTFDEQCTLFSAGTDLVLGYKCPTPKYNSSAQAISQQRGNCGAGNTCTTFNAAEQLVSTSGQYAYAAPKSNQIRGPCPGLNAAANHGYLSRTGKCNGSVSLTVQRLTHV